MKRDTELPFIVGVVRVDINLQDVDIDQCSTDGWFAGTHRCNLTTMEWFQPAGPGRAGSLALPCILPLKLLSAQPSVQASPNSDGGRCYG
ncbi:unnamed protein product [Pleuronectes platessa]|uniref:GPR158/179 extracellular domain-containing protein n=1 Tax=Pleuronectes platessa TaxID=8262 RepID=A0A9N7VA41_PLEPL|nr:unnamed protein product [Pleuronectes platessa]